MHPRCDYVGRNMDYWRLPASRWVEELSLAMAKVAESNAGLPQLYPDQRTFSLKFLIAHNCHVLPDSVSHAQFTTRLVVMKIWKSVHPKWPWQLGFFAILGDSPAWPLLALWSLLNILKQQSRRLAWLQALLFWSGGPSGLWRVVGFSRPVFRRPMPDFCLRHRIRSLLTGFGSGE